MIEMVFDRLLESLDEQGQEEANGEWEGKVLDRLEALRAAYDNLTEQGHPVIDYSDPATQAAYVFAYAIGRAEFTYQLLKRHREALGAPIFPNAEARITSLGGGPGSEIAGLVKYLLEGENGEKVESIKYWVFDKDKSWAPVCEALVAELNDFVPIELDYNELDLCDRKECGKISLEGDDLLILSFIISELCAISEKSKAEESLRELYKTIDNGAKIFYNDSNASSFYYFFNETKKYVKGFGKISQKSEIIDKITADLKFENTYERYMENFGCTPHSTSDALSKLLARCVI
jgi:hypothetical protein